MYNLTMDKEAYELLGKIAIAMIGVGGAYLVFRAKQKADAATKFRETILNEFQGLYPSPVDWPKTAGIEHRLKQSFPRLQAVVAGYRPYVRSKKAFDEAWNAYFCAYEWRSGEQCYHHYMDMAGTHQTLDGPVTEVTDAKGNFKANVARLLSFAD
jgi:hypothetical protein